MKLITRNLYRPAKCCTPPLMLCHEHTFYLSILLSEDDYQTRCTVSACPSSFVPHEAHNYYSLQPLVISLANRVNIAMQPPVFLTLVELASLEVTHG